MPMPSCAPASLAVACLAVLAWSSLRQSVVATETPCRDVCNAQCDASCKMTTATACRDDCDSSVPQSPPPPPSQCEVCRSGMEERCAPYCKTNGRHTRSKAYRARCNDCQSSCNTVCSEPSSPPPPAAPTSLPTPFCHGCIVTAMTDCLGPCNQNCTATTCVTP